MLLPAYNKSFVQDNLNVITVGLHLQLPQPIGSTFYLHNYLIDLINKEALVGELKKLSFVSMNGNTDYSLAQITLQFKQESNDFTLVLSQLETKLNELVESGEITDFAQRNLNDLSVKTE